MAMFEPTIALARAEGTAAVAASAEADPLFVTNNAGGPLAPRLGHDASFRAQIRAMSAEEYVALVEQLADGYWPDAPPYFTVREQWVPECPAALLILPGSDPFHPTSIAERICVEGAGRALPRRGLPRGGEAARDHRGDPSVLARARAVGARMRAASGGLARSPLGRMQRLGGEGREVGDRGAGGRRAAGVARCAFGVERVLALFDEDGRHALRRARPSSRRGCAACRRRARSAPRGSARGCRRARAPCVRRRGPGPRPRSSMPAATDLMALKQLVAVGEYHHQPDLARARVSASSAPG